MLRHPSPNLWYSRHVRGPMKNQILPLWKPPMPSRKRQLFDDYDNLQDISFEKKLYLMKSNYNIWSQQVRVEHCCDWFIWIVIHRLIKLIIVYLCHASARIGISVSTCPRYIAVLVSILTMIFRTIQFPPWRMHNNNNDHRNNSNLAPHRRNTTQIGLSRRLMARLCDRY